MRRFGTLSFGHYGPLGGGRSLTAQDNLLQAIDLTVGMDELGVDVAALRVHHFARQHAAPMPLLSAMAARTRRIHVGTGVIDMRYENPLYLAEEAGALDLLSGGRLMLGISRGSPETVVRGYEHFGYRGDDERGADLAARHLDTFLRAIEGEGIAERDPTSPFGSATGMQRIEPYSPTLRGNVWWGAGSTETAIRTGQAGMHLMSSTLLTEDRGMAFGDLQAEQLAAYRAAWAQAGHAGTPQTSVSRSVFPITTQEDALLFSGAAGRDQVGVIDGFRSTFGRTYAAEPDRLIEQLRADRAVMESDTLLLTIPSQLGVELNLRIVESFATHVAPALGWHAGG